MKGGGKAVLGIPLCSWSPRFHPLREKIDQQWEEEQGR